MEKITQSQYDLLVNSIYECLMGASLPCKCGEVATFGMGEMGEAREQATTIVKDWCEQSKIEIDF